MGEYSTSHIATYHLWHVSKSILDDSIKLRLFPQTLTDNASKWFIELQTTSFRDFSTVAMEFLILFQLPIRYEIGIYLLMSFRQSTDTYISNHIHKLWKRRRLVKVPIPDQLLVDWFTKSLLP